MNRQFVAVPKNHSRNRWAICIAGTLTVLLILADCLLGRPLMRQAGTRDFVSSPGTIIATSTADSYEKNHNPNPGMSFTYSAGGRKFLSHRDKFVWLPGDHTDDILHYLPAGCMIEVFYDPLKPSEAVLIRGLEKADLVYATVLVLLNLAALVYWLLPGWFQRDVQPGPSREKSFDTLGRIGRTGREP